MIKFENVSKKYDDNILFKNINLELKNNLVKIKGENGTGKSVFLKLIVGYSLPDEGNIVCDNLRVGKDCDFLQNAGVSINAPQFVSNWTGLENLIYLSNITKKCSNERLQELIKEFELDKDIKKKYRTYSLGMRQKMRIIQALMDEPKYLILDEPFDALDSKMKEKVKSYFNEYLHQHDESMLVYTSHSDEDDEFANSIYKIDEFSVKRIK